MPEPPFQPGQVSGKDDEKEETSWAGRCADAAGLDAVRMRPKAKQGKSAPKLAGTYYMFMLTPPLDVHVSDPDAAPPPYVPDPAPAASSSNNREPFVLMHMPKRGGQTGVAVQGPATAVDDVFTLVDAPSTGPLGAASETTPERPESPDEVMGQIERLNIPGAATNSDAGTLDRALALKTHGNQAYAAGEYPPALRFYSEAIEMLEDAGEDAALATLLCNRSIAYLRACTPASALTDAERARALGGGRAHFRRAEALNALERYEEALGSYMTVIKCGKEGIGHEGDLRASRDKISMMTVGTSFEDCLRSVMGGGYEDLKTGRDNAGAATNSDGQITAGEGEGDGTLGRAQTLMTAAVKGSCDICAHCEKGATKKGAPLQRCSSCAPSMKTCEPLLPRPEVDRKIHEAHYADDWQGVLKMEGRMEELMDGAHAIVMSRRDERRDQILGAFARAHAVGYLSTLLPDHALSAIRLDERRVELLGKMERFRDQAAAQCRIAHHLLFLGRTSEAATYFQRGRDLGAQHGFFSAESQACLGLGKLKLLEGKQEEGLELLRNAVAAAPLNESDDICCETNALGHLLDSLFKANGIDEAEPLVPRFREAAEVESRKEGRLCAANLESFCWSARLEEVLCILSAAMHLQSTKVDSIWHALHCARVMTHALLEPSALSISRHAESPKRPRGRCALCSTSCARTDPPSLPPLW